MKWNNHYIDVVKRPAFHIIVSQTIQGLLSDSLNYSLIMRQLMCLLATPSGTVIERKQTLVLKIYNKIFRLFLGMLLICGCHKLRDRKTYWERSTNTFVKSLSDSMSDQFQKGKQVKQYQSHQDQSSQKSFQQRIFVLFVLHGNK